MFSFHIMHPNIGREPQIVLRGVRLFFWGFLAATTGSQFILVQIGKSRQGVREGS